MLQELDVLRGSTAVGLVFFPGACSARQYHELKWSRIAGAHNTHLQFGRRVCCGGKLQLGRPSRRRATCAHEHACCSRVDGLHTPFTSGW